MQDRELTKVVDSAADDGAEDESPSKKKATPSERKRKAAADAADQEEEIPDKKDAGDDADAMLEHHLLLGLIALLRWAGLSLSRADISSTPNLRIREVD
jgi:hypothetical protein